MTTLSPASDGDLRLHTRVARMFETEDAHSGSVAFAQRCGRGQIVPAPATQRTGEESSGP